MTGYCQRCGKRGRSQMAIRNAERYAPFCSYDCQQRWRLAEAQEHLAELRAKGGQP